MIKCTFDAVLYPTPPAIIVLRTHNAQPSIIMAAVLIASRPYDDVPGEPIDHDSPVFFFGEKRVYGEFSQWRRSTFSVAKATIAAVCEVDVDGVEGVAETLVFGCAEQFMMFGKAVTFGDRAVQRQILATPDPAAQKKLGRRVRNYTDERWDAIKSAVVACGNIHKFGQSEKLQRVLLGTGNKLLVEAAPRDRIWGIGYGATNALGHRDTWGENRLGWALMQVRAALKAEAESK
ncbi:hypothetical protein F503_00249 [Ophiostoma piceae UAMH 11346]|uniref:NADAR domain-containing protein n=1 Tax=Ophiostoma piceae (strain UAMH 11346) TaxID=1262450 RepID=S3C402_OPHP1|nr:hypothetical protein F503_00249 [Ophiostoma piceae UAMH 11346]